MSKKFFRDQISKGNLKRVQDLRPGDEILILGKESYEVILEINREDKTIETPNNKYGFSDVKLFRSI